MAEALYRKYRPRIFEDVVGQEHIERTIKNAIAQDKVSHAYLFTGPRGTGKTTTARLLAKALLCEQGPTAEPDGTCEDCEMIAAGNHPDVYELDAASRTGVENVREEIIGRVQFAPTRGDYKVYIIDEVHMLSTAAFNALLKTLEEPPSHVVFILCTTDPQKVPETIHSRCQRFDFRRISNEAIVSRLGAICMEEQVEFEGDALELIASRAEGGMRNALTSLEQIIAFGEGKVTLADAERMLGALDTSDLAEIVQALGQRDVAAAFRWTADYVETGADLAQFTRDLAEHVRNMYVMALAGSKADVAVDLSETARREIAEELPLFGPDRLARMLGVLGDLSAELRVSTNPRLTFEIALTRMVRPDSDLTLEALAERIERLEQGRPVVTQLAPPVIEPQADLAGTAASTTREPGAELPADSVATAPARASVETETRSESSQDDSQLESRPVSQSASQPAAQPNPQPVSAQPLSERLQHDLENPAALQRLWQAVLTDLKQRKPALGVLFLNTKAVYDDAKRHLTIEFPAESDFAFGAASKPEAGEELERSIEKVCAATIPFSLAKGSKGRPSSPQTADPRSQARPQTQSASEPEPSQPQAQPQPQVQQRPASAAPDEPYYDEVPLDAYDFAPAQVEPARQEVEPQAASARPTPSQPQQTQPAAAAGAATHPTSDEPTAADLDAVLAASFGDGLAFTEVNE